MGASPTRGRVVYRPLEGDGTPTYTGAWDREEVAADREAVTTTIEPDRLHSWDFTARSRCDDAPGVR